MTAIKTTLSTKKSSTRRSRIFAKSPISPEQLQQRRIEAEELDQRCSQYFDKIYARLGKTHYNWYVAIEIDSGYYLLDSDWESLIRRVNIYCPKGKLMMYGLNETQTCGQI